MFVYDVGEEDTGADNQARRRLAKHRTVTVQQSSSSATGHGQPRRPLAETPSAASTASSGVDDVEMQNYQPSDHEVYRIGYTCHRTLSRAGSLHVVAWPGFSSRRGTHTPADQEMDWHGSYALPSRKISPKQLE